MPSNFTENYNLSQWERTDKIQMEDFNADNAKIDGAIKAQADGLAAEAEARLALAAQVAKCGNCKIYYTTYTSNVWYDGFIPLPGRPELLFLFNQDCELLVASRYAKAAIHYAAGAGGGQQIEITWSDSGLALGSGTHTWPNSGMFVIAFFALS